MKAARGVKRGLATVQLWIASNFMPLAQTESWKVCMARWIAFDQQTSSLLRSQVAPENKIETFGRGALEYALAKPGAVVALLPSVGGEIGIAVFRRPRPVRTEVQRTMPRVAPSSGSTRAGGFLGLRDEPVFEDESPVQEKKGWWKRFWDE